MTDEFDEILQPVAPSGRTATSRTPGPRLVARIFASAGNPLRVRLLRCLMRPLGPLGAAGVAAGAFAVFLSPSRGGEPVIEMEAAARVSSQQVRELAHFVEQVDPQALQQFASVVANSSLGMATFSASALVLLYRRLQPDPEARGPNGPQT